MSSSNSFNICPRCGNSNMLNAKYCSRCGGELKLPEEPIVCHNCRTRNTPMANFCRNCGAELKIGYATKICTRCGSEVPAEQSICTCGYSFANTVYATPTPVRADGTVGTGITATGAQGNESGVATDKMSKKEQKRQEKLAKKESEKSKVYSHKGGRAFAIVALVLLLAFAYFVIVPGCIIRPLVISNLDQGMFTDSLATSTDGTSVRYYGYDVAYTFVNAILGDSFGETIANNGGTVVAIIAVLTAIFAVAVVAHLIVCIVRIIRPRRSRKPNFLFLALAALTTVVVGLIVLFNFVSVGDGFFAIIASVFQFADGWALGYVLYAIPIYFWFFFLYSLIAKARALKEETVTPVAEEQTAA